MSRASWILVGMGVLVLWASSAAGLGRVGSALLLVLLGACSLILGRLARRRALSSIVRVSDAQFLKQLSPKLEIAEDRLLAERRHVGKVLGIDPEYLSAEQQFRDLSQDLDFMGDFSVALNDLQYEIEELHETTCQDQPVAFPESVGVLVQQLALMRLEAERS